MKRCSMTCTAMEVSLFRAVLLWKTCPTHFLLSLPSGEKESAAACEPPLPGKQQHEGSHTADKTGYADPKEFTSENLPLPLSGEIGRSATPLSGNDGAHE